MAIHSDPKSYKRMSKLATSCIVYYFTCIVGRLLVLPQSLCLTIAIIETNARATLCNCDCKRYNVLLRYNFAIARLCSFKYSWSHAWDDT